MTTTPSTPLRCGAVGVGRMGQHHARVYAEMEGVELIGVVDANFDRAKEIASTVANHGPIAARYLKEAVLKGMDSTLEQGLRLEADLNFILQSTSDRAEGISSFLNRRDPDYRGE